MKVMIGCGGTGGHITPALAIADTVRQNCPHAEILFVGARGGMEEEMVTRAGYQIRLLAVRGLSRSLSLANLKTLYMARKAVCDAGKLIAEHSPDIVIGTGGYASYPALRAAVKHGIPTAVHESNAVPGLAVRRLAPQVDRVWLNFAAAAETLPRGASTLCVGNPLPRGYAVPQPTPLPRGCRKMVLSFGGSLGAGEINRAVLELMEEVAKHPEVYHLHAAGKRCFEEMHAEFCARGLDGYPNLSLVPFLTDMPQQMASATLVISRAGAMTLSELAALKKPAVLIPSPNVTGNHQYKNAKALGDKGAAILLEEAALRAGQLTRVSFALLEDPRSRRKLSDAIGAFYHPQANAEIWADIKALCHK